MRLNVPIQIVPQSAASTSATAAESARADALAPYRLGYALFLVLNAVLFIRPAEILPAVEGWPIYNVVIVAALLASLPAVLGQLTWGNLRAQPGILCVVLLLPAVVLSHLTHGDTWSARERGIEFLKVVLYFLLLTGLVSTLGRLKSFVLATVVFIVAIAGLAVLQYHDVVQLQGMSALERREGLDEETGQAAYLLQLRGPGIFNDPNDLSLILVFGMLVLAHCALMDKGLIRRLRWAVPVPVLGYAFALTHSRGGFLALAAGLLVLLVGRLGWKRSIPYALVALAALLVVFSGRQTSINLTDEDDTAQGRIRLWRDGFVEMKAAPLFGIGAGQYAEAVGHVAHNSFVHSYTELGLFGGTFFTAAFYIPWSVLRWRAASATATSSAGMQWWRPCLLAVLVGYAVGLCSLSRCYTQTTYLVVGLAAVYCGLLAREAPMAMPAVSGTLIKRMLGASLGCLVAFYVFVRIFAR